VNGSGPGGQIRILVADDHPVVRAGLTGMLAAEPDLQVVGEAASGDEAVALAGQLNPDVVLMDLRMPGGDGVSATTRIRAARPEVKIMVLTTYDNDADILRAVEAGAAGYLLKDLPRAELAAAIRAAARGETVLAPAVAGRLLNRLRGGEAPAGELPALSAREAAVLGLAARGLTNAEIGRELFISEATVKTHLLHIYAKFGVNDRAAAVANGFERGLLPRPVD
jgi:DNA-binding NarL/FixJ family response regulator